MRKGGARRPGAGSARARVSSHGQRPSEVRKRIAVWRDNLSRQANEHPGRTVAIALGAGYLLGGGLFSRLTARILGTGLRIGLRVALVPVVTQGIVALGEGLLSRADSVSDDDNGDPTNAGSTAPSDRQNRDQKETHS